MCLRLFNIPIILEHLLDTFSECFFSSLHVYLESVLKNKFFYFFYDCITHFGSEFIYFFVVHVEQHEFSVSYIK